MANGWFPVWGERTYVMGVLNATPDSFSGDGLYRDTGAMAERAVHMAASGADVLDIGGESTRPGFQTVPVDEELRRVIPAVRAVTRAVDLPVSVDTRRAEVAEQAIAAGARIINDVSGTLDDAMLWLAVRERVTMVLVHRGRPEGDLLGNIATDLGARATRLLEAGATPDSIILDPGLGIGKTWRENFAILRRLPELRMLGRPLLLGPSRKGMIGVVLGVAPDDRLEGSEALAAICAAQGADVVRVHDVPQMVRVVRMIDAIVRPPGPP